MPRVGCARWAHSSERQTQTGDRRQRFLGFARHPPTGRRRRRSPLRYGAAERQHPGAIDDLQAHAVSRRRLRHRHRARSDADGCDDVYYCVVDTSAWLRDPAPLFRTNVEGLRNVLDVAVKEPSLRRFVFTSSYVTVGRLAWPRGHRGRRDRLGWADSLRSQSRVQAEDLVMRYVTEAGLPAVAMCVSTTYGGGDWGRTPHGAFIAGAVFGKLPFVMNGIQLEVVGVDDAARAMILAAEHGRVGERYLISERMIPLTDVVRIAADEAGKMPPPARSISVPALYALAALGSLKARLTGKDAELSLKSVRMMRAEADVDHSKAVRELGWQPRPVEESIREAARFWNAMRDARKAAENTSGNTWPANLNRLAEVDRVRVDLTGPPQQTMLRSDVVRQGARRRCAPLDPERPLRQGGRGAHRLRLGSNDYQCAEGAVGRHPHAALRQLDPPVPGRARARPPGSRSVACGLRSGCPGVSGGARSGCALV